MILCYFQHIQFSFEDKTKLSCWSTRPTDPILIKNKKGILQNFGRLAFLKSIIFCFLKKNLRNKT